MAATLLAQNNSRIIGVVINDHIKYEGHVLEDPFISAAINALTDEIEKAGYFMMIKKTTQIMDTISFSSMWNMEGMIILGFCASEYKVLRDRIRIPFVVYDGFFENDSNICNLMIDDRDGGRQVGKYLKEKQCENVLCIADNKCFPDYDRYEGLCEGYGKAADFWELPMQKEKRLLFYEKRMKDFSGYGAVFAVSDYYALEIMYFLIDKGYRIPDDIWIIGFDDLSLGKHSKPELASVSQNVRVRAEKAVDYIKKMKADKDYSMTEMIPVSFIPRRSCGYPDDNF
jgi:LacI family transcriptional regulator